MQKDTHSNHTTVRAPSAFNRLRFPDAHKLRQAFDRGEVSPQEHLNACLDRIENHHPRLNAAVHTFAEEAKAAIAQIRQGKLAGIPLSIKEVIATAGTPVTAGSFIYTQHTPSEDATVVQRLKAAGAIVVAKGNVPEFSMSHETQNLRFGRTNNPYDPDRIPGGSSGGEAALVATGGATIGIGTDLGGSVRYPAHCCGLVGFKPTSETLDKTGVYPEISSESFLYSMISVGTITQTVADARLATEIMAGNPFPINRRIGEGGRLLVPEKFMMTVRRKNIAQALDSAAAHLASNGFTKVATRVDEVPSIYLAFLRILMRNTFGRTDRPTPLTPEGKQFTLLGETLRQLKGEPLVWSSLYYALLGVPLLNPSAKQALAEQQKVEGLRAKYTELLGNDGILLLPTSGDVALKHGAAARHDFFSGIPRLFTPMIFTNVLDLPSVTVPAWRFRDSATGFPASIMLSARPGNEDFLLETATLLEEVMNSTPEN